MKTNIIYNKDCIEGMKELPDESCPIKKFFNLTEEDLK